MADAARPAPDLDDATRAQEASAARAASAARIARWHGERGPAVLRPSDHDIAAWRRPREFRIMLWSTRAFVVVAVGVFLLFRPLPGWIEPVDQSPIWIAVRVGVLAVALGLFVLTEYRVGGMLLIDPAARTLTWKRHFTGAVRHTWSFDELQSVEGHPRLSGSELRITLPEHRFSLGLVRPGAEALAESLRAAAARPPAS